MLEMWSDFHSRSCEPVCGKTSRMQNLQENRPLRQNEVQVQNSPATFRKTNQRGAYWRSRGQGSRLRVRQIQENLLEEQEDQVEQEEIESVDPESTLYIKKLSEDWADVNHIAPETFSEVKNIKLNVAQTKKIWVETTTTHKFKIQWLADTGSPRSFITRNQANKIMKHNPMIQLHAYTSQTKYKFFNNNNIKIEGKPNLTLQSGS